jgi:hypothetical protein
LNGDDAVDDADPQEASAWRRVHYNGVASAAMAMVVSEAVFLARELAEKNQKEGKEWWRRRGRRVGFAWARSGE